MNNFKAMKFRVKSPNHSRSIQEKLFEMGYKWYGDGQKVKNITSPYLFSAVSGIVTHRPDIEYDFENDSNDEYELKELTTQELIPVQKKDIVIFDGKEYNKVHFKELLKEVLDKL